MENLLSYDPCGSARCFECVHFRKVYFTVPEGVGFCKYVSYTHSGFASCAAFQRVEVAHE